MKERQTTHVLEGVKDAFRNEEALGWRAVCSTVEEWTNLVEQLSGTKQKDTRRLVSALQGQLFH